MTASPSVAAPPAPAAPTARPRFVRSRLLIPLGVSLLVIVFTIVSAIIEAPHQGSDDFLSPRSEGGHGAATLAGSLSDAGVTVDQYTDPTAAFQAAATGDATVFVPAPQYLNSDEWYLLSGLRETEARVVLVLPPPTYLTTAGLYEKTERIATKTVAPGDCGLAEAEEAGAAAVLRQPYDAREDSGSDYASPREWQWCYDGGLAWNQAQGYQEIVIGSPEPFTDEHIGDAGNMKLATGLLAAHSTVVWLDQHSLTPRPQPSIPDRPTSSDRPTQEPSRDPIQYPGARDPSPVYTALPAWIWAGLVGLLLAGIGVVLWKGRRLGPPVVEPLPVTVPSAETVHGRARLYRRAGAYPETLRALRAGALHRIRPTLRISSQADDTEIVTAVTARIGWTSQQVTEILFSAQPSTEAQLLGITAALDDLVIAVETASPQGSNE
jgi:hypothetical protein